MVQCPAASLYFFARNPSHLLMKSIPEAETDRTPAWALASACGSLSECMKLSGKTVVTRLLDWLCENVRSSELIVRFLCPWITGALSFTNDMFSKSSDAASDSEPGIGRAVTNARTT